MSQRTIIEINHDMGFQIDKDPEGFVSAIQTLINSGVNCNPENKRGVQLEQTLSDYGIRVSPTHHHSEDAELTLKDRGRVYYTQKF